MLWCRLARSKGASAGWQPPTRSILSLSDEVSGLHCTTKILTHRNFSHTAISAFPGKLWSLEEEQELIELRKQGIKWSHMKFHIPDRSYQSIKGHFHWMTQGSGPLAQQAKELKGPAQKKSVPITQEDVERAIRLREQGLKAYQIDEQIGKGHGVGRINTVLRQPELYLKPRRRPSFTPEDDVLLATLVSKGLRWSEIAKRFPSKSVTSLQTRWDQVRLSGNKASVRKEDSGKKRPWTKQDLERMLEMYKQGMRIRAIANELDRSDRFIRDRLVRLGLVQQDSQHFHAAAARDMLNNLPSRRSRRVSLTEGAKMRDMFISGTSVQEIARTFARSTTVVKYWLEKSHLHVPVYPNVAWTREEEERLAELHARGTEVSAIAEELGRTKGAVSKKLHHPQHHTRKPEVREERVFIYNSTHWSTEERHRLAELRARGMRAEDIAEELGRTKASVCAQIVLDRKKASGEA